MGRKTSVYLDDDLAARWQASGVALSELVRRGLDAGSEDLAARVGRVVLEAVASAGLSGEAAGHTAPLRHTASEVHTVPDTAHTAVDTVKTAAKEKSAPKPRPGACPHRLPAGAYCRTCDRTKT